MTISEKAVEEINKLIKDGEFAITEEGKDGSASYFGISYVSGEKTSSWKNRTLIFCERYLTSHPLYEKIYSICTAPDDRASEAKELLGLLKDVSIDNTYWDEFNQAAVGEADSVSKKIFIVHGHYDAAKLDVARTLEHAEFDPIILHEQPNSGQTIIEKIENNTDVSFAIVIYTACDKGMEYDADPSNDLRPRARQNVVFEHGYLIGKLGRNCVCISQRRCRNTRRYQRGYLYKDG